jgi:uncharacterized damage-inducible protein DinB
MSDDLRFPIGRFEKPTHVSAAQRASFVERLRVLPATLRAAVSGLDAAQQHTPYRDGGWTVHQVVFHLGDSHANFLIRLKLSLTEERPTIRPYDENLWLATGDALTATLDDSLAFLDAMHHRLVAVAAAVNDTLGARTLVHPQSGEFTVNQLLAMYAWHGDHHVAHITALRARRGW